MKIRMKLHMMPARHRKHTLFVALVLFVFLILLSSMIITGVLFIIGHSLGFMRDLSGTRGLGLILMMLLTSILIGTVLTTLTGRRSLRPFQPLIRATEEVAKGNFDVRVESSGLTELGQLAESFNHMAKELGSIETLRSDFVSNVSHEFKTPVASIKGFAKLLTKESLSSESRKEYLDIIIREADRLAKLSSNVLLLSKLEKQEDAGEVSYFSLDEQLRRVILTLEPAFQKKDISLDIDLAPAGYLGSEGLLHHVWMNLLDNAVKFTPQGGRVGVRLTREKGTVVVRVSDTGCGMDRETADSIFVKFYQGDKSHSTEGNGLGMSLAKQVLDLSGGEISVESTAGEGTTFTVRLPEMGTPD